MDVTKEITRRDFIKAAGAGLFLAGLHCALPLPAWALKANAGIKKRRPKSRYDLTIGYSPFRSTVGRDRHRHQRHGARAAGPPAGRR